MKDLVDFLVVSFLVLLEKSCPFCYIEELASWSANMLLTVRSAEVKKYKRIEMYFSRTTSSIECELLEVRNSREEKETGQLLTWVKNRMKAKIWKSRDTREENEDGGKHPIRVGR
nr:uncharacterized protein LOC131786353 isoform X1 [Pocillopora verrucosa]